MKPMLRWILLLPVALSAGYIAYFVGGTINRISMTMFVGPLEGWYHLAAIFLEQMYCGAAVLYVGGRVAPSHKRLTVFTLSGLLLIFVSFSTGLIMTQNSSASLPDSISSTLGIAFAVGAMIVAMERDEIDLGQKAV